MGELFLPIIGIGFVAYGLWARHRVEVETDKLARSVCWPSTKGEVTRSEIVLEQDRAGGVFTHAARIEYAYVVDGRTYEADTPILGATVEWGDQQAKALCARYPTGAAVEVTYDPTDPEISFLERSEIDPRFMSWIVNGVLALGVLMLLRGIYAIFG
jgi:hypothetical protein